MPQLLRERDAHMELLKNNLALAQTRIKNQADKNRTDKQYVYDKLSKTLKEHAADFVTFEAFCERKNGYLPVQKLAEKSILCYERRIRPGLVNLKRRLKG